jgi:hypothetical protein
VMFTAARRCLVPSQMTRVFSGLSLRRFEPIQFSMQQLVSYFKNESLNITLVLLSGYIKIINRCPLFLLLTVVSSNLFEPLVRHNEVQTHVLLNLSTFDVHHVAS